MSLRPSKVQLLALALRIPDETADVALLLKLVTTLDRQDPAAADRVLAGQRVLPRRLQEAGDTTLVAGKIA